MPAILETPRASLYHDDHLTLAARLRREGEMVDLVAVDTPYSKRTHAGHDGTLPGGRNAISYAYWTPDDVARFVDTWRPLNRGWLVSITDHVLWPEWQRRAAEAGLYAGFPPLPLVITGSRVRLRGDGPSCWTYYLMVARPPELADWGTLPGAYYGKRERLPISGGKPIWAMRDIVRDYSRRGNVVCDPCCGAGTTLVASILEGRLAIGSDPVDRAIMKAETRVLSALEGVNPGGHVLSDDEEEVEDAAE
jgi:hypothetical protein